MQLSDIVALSDDVVAREVAGETVLLNLATGTYFGLNPVGGRVWHMLEGEGTTLGAVSAALHADFDVSEAEAAADVLELAHALAEHGLITVSA